MHLLAETTLQALRKGPQAQDIAGVQANTRTRGCLLLPQALCSCMYVCIYVHILICVMYVCKYVNQSSQNHTSHGHRSRSAACPHAYHGLRRSRFTKNGGYPGSTAKSRYLQFCSQILDESGSLSQQKPGSRVQLAAADPGVLSSSEVRKGGLRGVSSEVAR